MESEFANPPPPPAVVDSMVEADMAPTVVTLASAESSITVASG